MVTTSRCTGHCCKRFYLPYTSKLEFADVVSHGRVQDGPFILDMLIKLPEQTTDIRGKRLRKDDPQRHEYWTCRHYDTKTGDCRVYDQRPAMCRDYPYGKPCVVKGCTSSCALKGDGKTLTIMPNMERK